MRLTCVVENVVQSGSPLWGEHGLSVLIETEAGNLLWDTGASGTVLQHNLDILGLSEMPLYALALSHAHYDHTGGVDSVLERHAGINAFAEASFFRPRYSVRDHEPRLIGCSAQQERWATLANWHLDDGPTEILPGVSTTGPIKAHPYPLGAGKTLMIKRDGALVPDPYRDDISLVLRVTKGIVLQLGCCHAGLRNTLLTVRGQYDEPLVAILGGTHLAQAPQAELETLAQTLIAEGRPQLYLNHCTGDRAIRALEQAMDQRVTPCSAGTVADW